MMASSNATRQAALNYNGAQRPALGVMPGMSPLSETLWRDRTNTEKVGDTSARLTWVDLWVTIHHGGSKQAILQGLTGMPHHLVKKFIVHLQLSESSEIYDIT